VTFGSHVDANSQFSKQLPYATFDLVPDRPHGLKWLARRI